MSSSWSISQKMLRHCFPNCLTGSPSTRRGPSFSPSSQWLPSRIPGASLQRMGENGLIRITDHDGKARKSTTLKQLAEGRTKGSAKQQNCLICRKYLLPDNRMQYKGTSWQCRHCGMPLCSKDRRIEDPTREKTCKQEHDEAQCKVLGCWTADEGRTFTFPKGMCVNLHPPAARARSRSSARKKKRRRAIADDDLPDVDRDHLLPQQV